MNLLSSVIIFAGLFTSRPLTDPLPVQVDSSRNPDQVFAATLDAANSSGWNASVVDKNTIRAVLARGPHVAMVLVRVDHSSVSMKYESSTNLDYGKQGSGQSIHKAYMEWTGTLMNSIRS